MTIVAPVEKNVDLSEQFIQVVFNDREYDRIEEFLAPEFLMHGAPGGGDLSGTDAYLEMLREAHEGFSDLEATVEECFGTDDLVCSRISYTGTHDGEYLGVPATGTEVAISSTGIHRFEDGRIAETWVNLDTLGLLAQLGVVDLPGN